MKYPALISLLSLGIVLFGCGDKTEPKKDGDDHKGHSHDDGHDHDHDHDHDHGTDSKPASKPNKKTGMLRRLDVKKFDHFGGGAHEGEVMTPAHLAANVADFKGKEVRVKGTVSSVCKGQGCWLILGDGDNKIFVSVGHDENQKVPLDCEDRLAVVEGKFDHVPDSKRAALQIDARVGGVALVKVAN